MRQLFCEIPDIDMKKTGAHLQALRLNHTYSVQTIASFAGVSVNAVYKWENGTNLPNISNLAGLKELYDLNYLDELLVYTKLAA